MQTLFNGTFIREEKHRFLCTVEINGKYELCYTGSSARLSSNIHLEQSKVLLTRGKNSTRTKYSLFALDGQRKAMLNLNYVNQVVFLQLSKIYKYAIKREVLIKGPSKVDFMISKKRRILIEAKGVLSSEKSTTFPSMKVNRAENQLKSFIELLENGERIQYIIVNMNPLTKYIVVNKQMVGFCKDFHRCLALGMELKMYNAKWVNNDFQLTRAKILEKAFKNSVL